MQTEKSKFLGTTRLGGMNIATLPCSKFAGKTLLGEKVQVTEVWGKSKAPMFLCSAPREDVGLCDGDSGGKLGIQCTLFGICGIRIYMYPLIMIMSSQGSSDEHVHACSACNWQLHNAGHTTVS